MKRLIFIVISLFVMACQQGNNNNNTPAPAKTATTPLTCINGGAYCNNNGYAQNQGWMPYPGMYNYAYNYTNTFNQSGFCNCPAGYAPTYNGTYGLGCVNTQILQPYAGFYAYWSFGWGGNYYYPAPQIANNYPQYSNIPNNYSGQCASTLTQSCLLNQPNSCGVGAFCQPLGNGSVLGICSRQ